MSKKCINCGAELAEGASFCPSCETSQREKRVTVRPRLWRKKAAVALGCGLVLALAAVIFALSGKAALQTVEGSGSVVYSDGDGTYELILAYHPNAIEAGDAAAQRSVTQPVGETANLPAMLGVRQDGKAVDPALFFDKVERCTLALAADGTGALSFTEPAYDADFFPAARVSHLTYDGNSGANELIWTLSMKNGDVIRLRQTLEVIPLVHQTYTPEDTPLDTMEELKALLLRIQEEVPVDAVVDIYLAPVVYEGDLTLDGRAVNLYGGSNGEEQTTFTGTLTINADSPSLPTLAGVKFEGQGGVGLAAFASVFIECCTFTGWDVGAAAKDGGMILTSACIFEHNGIGFQYDSARHQSFASVFPDCVLSDNGIGVQFLTLNNTITIDFAGSVFSGNGIDIDNQIDYPIITERAVFE